jgi:hypothetical protein
MSQKKMVLMWERYYFETVTVPVCFFSGIKKMKIFATIAEKRSMKSWKTS